VIHRFRSMGTTVEAEGFGAGEADRLERLFERWERTFSRFRTDSELVAVNQRAGRRVLVSPLFARVVRAALELASATEGLVVPTVGRALSAAGYASDFQLLSGDEPVELPQRVPDWRSVMLTGRVLRAPADCCLDLNGVVKSMVVDEALALLDGPGWVSAGGDIATWTGLDVGLPRGGAVRLVSGGIATSGCSRRRWVARGVEQHHLINPTTGAPAPRVWEQVTAVGVTCLDADAAAKAAFLAGADGPNWLDARELPGRFIRPDGSAHLNASWRAMLGQAACT
jgi:thiamine biosynthesis lipoprotein